MEIIKMPKLNEIDKKEILSSDEVAQEKSTESDLDNETQK